MGQWLTICITAKFRVRPDWAEQSPEIAEEFTGATRAEPGRLWFEWSRTLEDSSEYVLVEAFRDAAGGTAHVQSEHFRRAQSALPPYLAETPRIVSTAFEQDDWSELDELAIPGN